VEVLSPSTTKRDVGVKKDLYEKYGVREYWIADPEAKSILVYLNQSYKKARQ
jgi:Uma2 family endonuclease